MTARLRLAAFVAVAVVTVAVQVAPHRCAGGTSFPGYWVVARAVWAGTPAVQLYDDAWLAARMEAEGFPPDRMLGPPALALTASPVAPLPYPTARPVWLFAVLTPALLGALGWLAARDGSAAGIVLAGAWALSRPVEAGMAVGQIYPLMLLLHVAGLAAWARGRPRSGAAALAPMVLVRGWYGLLPALGWAVGRRPSGLVWTLGLAALGAAATLPLLGIEGWWYFLTEQSQEVAASERALVLAYQTWRSLALHLTTHHPRFGPDPPLAGLGVLPWLVGVAVVAGATLWAGRQRGPGTGDLGFALWTAASVLLAPFAEDHHMLLLALPSMVLWRAAPRTRLVVVVALLLLLPPWPYDRPDLLGGWRGLAAYPRVYGAAMLWAACAWACLQPEPTPGIPAAPPGSPA